MRPQVPPFGTFGAAMDWSGIACWRECLEGATPRQKPCRPPCLALPLWQHSAPRQFSSRGRGEGGTELEAAGGAPPLRRGEHRFPPSPARRWYESLHLAPERRSSLCQHPLCQNNTAWRRGTRWGADSHFVSILRGKELWGKGSKGQGVKVGIFDTGLQGASCVSTCFARTQPGAGARPTPLAGPGAGGGMGQGQSSGSGSRTGSSRSSGQVLGRGAAQEVHGAVRALGKPGTRRALQQWQRVAGPGGAPDADALRELLRGCSAASRLGVLGLLAALMKVRFPRPPTPPSRCPRRRRQQPRPRPRAPRLRRAPLEPGLARAGGCTAAPPPSAAGAQCVGPPHCCDLG